MKVRRMHGSDCWRGGGPRGNALRGGPPQVGAGRRDGVGTGGNRARVECSRTAVGSRAAGDVAVEMEFDGKLLRSRAVFWYRHATIEERSDGRDVQRVVLDAWYEHGSLLWLNQGVVELRELRR